MYRDEQSRQMLIPGDSNHAEKVQGPDVPPIKVPDNFRSDKTFNNYHPGHDKDNNPKVS